MFYLVLRVDREGRAIARGHVVTLPWSSHRWLNSLETASIVTASRRGQVITVTSPPRARSTVSPSSERPTRPEAMTAETRMLASRMIRVGRAGAGGQDHFGEVGVMVSHRAGAHQPSTPAGADHGAALGGVRPLPITHGGEER